MVDSANNVDHPVHATVSFGGWYQRTTLHLSEVYDLFSFGSSRLPLDSEKLLSLQQGLDLEKVTRETGSLEYVQALTNEGIEIRYYEDGLYILEQRTGDIKSSQKLLEDYFEHKFLPAVNYIFSLGAPTPKILANIETKHPTVVSLFVAKRGSFQIDRELYGEVYSSLTSGGVTVHKTPSHIFIVTSVPSVPIRDLVEMQIFFREFKDQLEKYLNIHRVMWEKIEDIKDQRKIQGNRLEDMRKRLDSYQKTIDLISNRINQMGSYIGTRRSISQNLKIEEQLTSLFQYKFEVLQDTLCYIKEIWAMTKDYLKSAIQVLVEIQNKTANTSINSLRLITTIGVVAGIFGYLARDQWPKVTPIGLFYFALLLALTWVINTIVGYAYKRRSYELTFTEREEEI